MIKSFSPLLIIAIRFILKTLRKPVEFRKIFQKVRGFTYVVYYQGKIERFFLFFVIVVFVTI